MGSSSAPDWVLQASGDAADWERFDFRSEVSTHRSLGETPLLRPWWSAIWIVELDEQGEEIDRVEIASAGGVHFAVPEIGTGEWGQLLEEADEESGDREDVIASLSEAGDLTEKLGMITTSALYVERVWVDPRVRGHRWGCTAIATLVGALDLTFGVVLAHPPLVGDEARPAVEGMVDTFGAVPLGESGLVIAHGSRRPFGQVVSKWLSGPFGVR